MSRLKNKEFKIEKVICTLMFVMGLIMSFVMPTWQTPDEPTHLYQISKAIGNDDFLMIMQNELDLDVKRIAFHPDEKMDWDKQLEVMTKAPSYTRSEMMPHKISFSLIKHLPSFIGMMIGILLGLPAYWTMQLGELGSLLFYVFVCYHAIKIMPFKKQLFGLMQIIPMALQQAGCIGYDTIFLSMCALYIAYTFYLKYTKETIESSDILKMFGIFLLITYLKAPCVVFGLLVFLLPADKMHLQIGKKICFDGAFFKKYKIPLILGFIGLIAIGIFALRNYYYMQILIACVLEWKRVLLLIQYTLILWGIPMIGNAIGMFGWVDTPMNYKVAGLVYVVFFIVALVKMNPTGKETMKLRRMDYAILWGTFLLLTLLTILSMVNHTITTTLFGEETTEQTYNIREALYVIQYIGGLQGRYFTPYICLPFLGLPCILKWDNKKVCVITDILEIILFVYIIVLLLQRYWIA